MSLFTVSLVRIRSDKLVDFTKKNPNVSERTVVQEKVLPTYWSDVLLWDRDTVGLPAGLITCSCVETVSLQANHAKNRFWNQTVLKFLQQKASCRESVPLLHTFL